MHKLLRRQLSRQLGADKPIPDDLRNFIAAVDDAYKSFDQDRILHERSLELTSEELLAKNRLLQREGEDTRQIIARSQEGLAVAREGRYVFVNPKWASSLGYDDATALAGLPAEDVVFPEDLPIMLERIRRAEQTGTNRTDEVRFVTKSGGTVLLELSPGQLIHFEGEPAYLMSARDVTNRKRDEQRMLHTARMASMGTLTAGIAHELNNPLSFMMSNLAFVVSEIERLAGADPGFDEVKAALSDAREGADRVREIVQGLKAFSRSDSESAGPVSLRRVVSSAAKLAMNEIRPKAKFVLEIGTDAAAEGNEAKLGQVIVNLLVNAAQAIPEGSESENEVRVRTRQQGDRVCIEVSDTGGGIPEEIQAKIFEPFFTTKPIGVGTGLGLAICHGIVAAMNGRIEVESAPGKGTTFRVWLQVSAAEERSTLAQAAVSSKRGRILVVDDEPKVGVSIQRALTGHEVVYLSSGAEAMAKLAAGERFDVLLCDVMMPGMSGMELFERLPPHMKARTAFVTGGAFTASARDFLTRVANRKIAKPFTSDDLQSAVAELLAQPETAFA